MSTIIIITPPPPPPPPPPSGPKSETQDIVRIGETTVEFQGGRPTFGALCRAVVHLFRAWQS